MTVVSTGRSLALDSRGARGKLDGGDDHREGLRLVQGVGSVRGSELEDREVSGVPLPQVGRESCAGALLVDDDCDHR